MGTTALVLRVFFNVCPKRAPVSQYLSINFDATFTTSSKDIMFYKCVHINSLYCPICGKRKFKKKCQVYFEPLCTYSISYLCTTSKVNMHRSCESILQLLQIYPCSYSGIESYTFITWSVVVCMGIQWVFWSWSRQNSWGFKFTLLECSDEVMWGCTIPGWNKKLDGYGGENLNWLIRWLD